MTTRAIVVRHGQSSYNTERRIQGRSDVSTLTQKGHDDALKTGEALSHLQFDAIYSSPLQRAKTTAEAIGQCLVTPTQIQTTDKLKEIDLPLWEGMLSQEVKDNLAQDYRLWKQHPDEFMMLLPQADGGEKKYFPVLELYEQARQFWQEILTRHEEKTILIVGHNGINRALISAALGIAPSRYHSIQQSNCGVSVLNFSGKLGQSVQLESMNQTGHLGEVLPSLRPNHQGVRLLLIRHGETEWNRQTKFQGQIDVPLNDNWRSQHHSATGLLNGFKYSNNRRSKAKFCRG